MPNKPKIVERTTEGTVRPNQPGKSASKAKGSQKAAGRNTAKAKTAKKSTAPERASELDALGIIDIETQNSELNGEVQIEPDSDFQGISPAEEADSESVEELVEEGNVFESGAVAGVEKADNEDGRGVHTRQLLEDDVPEEYDNMD